MTVSNVVKLGPCKYRQADTEWEDEEACLSVSQPEAVTIRPTTVVFFKFLSFLPFCYLSFVCFEEDEECLPLSRLQIRTGKV